MSNLNPQNIKYGRLTIFILKILKSFLKILKRFILQMDIIDLQQLPK